MNKDALLIQLDLWDNLISDIGPLAVLTDLRSIRLAGNQISDVGPLSTLTNLEELYLEGNEIKDVSPLASLTNLARIGLGYNQVTDISPLASFTFLASLTLIDNPLSEASVGVLNDLRHEGVHVTTIESKRRPTKTYREYRRRNRAAIAKARTAGSTVNTPRRC